MIQLIADFCENNSPYTMPQDEISPPFNIDNKTIEPLINALEKIGTGLAFFACGQLLSCAIKTNAAEDISDTAKEIRLHAAISFYIKASCEKPLKHMIDFIFLDLRTRDSTPLSVKARLNTFDLTSVITEKNLAMDLVLR